MKYDPKLLGDTDVMSAPLSDKILQQGHKVTLVAHNQNQRPVCLNTVVTDVQCVTIPHNGVSDYHLSTQFRPFLIYMMFLDRHHDSEASIKMALHWIHPWH